MTLSANSVSEHIVTGPTASGLHRVVLGDNQFFGVNHMSQERSFAQAERFSQNDAILDIMREARGLGVAGMMLHSHPRAEAICDRLRSDEKEWQDFCLYPCIPYAFKYVMALNEKGMYAVVMDQIKKAGVGASMGLLLQGSVGIMAKDYLRLIRTLIDLEMQIYRRISTPVVFLHNVVVDLILALGIEGVLPMFAELVRDKYGARPGFGSLNLPRLVAQLNAERIEDAVIMTSVNREGFFMNPSREACEEILSNPKLDVMAMSILASGAIPAEQAFPYCVQFPAVKSLLFGASRKESLQKSLAIIHDLGFRKPPAL